jgi:hypothetical protein
MAEYTADLRRLELIASADNPMPALDAIVRDHKGAGWKTLSVSTRDCVRGNCLPIDSRVEKELHRRDLPVDERELVRISLQLDRNHGKWLGCSTRREAGRPSLSYPRVVATLVDVPHP